MFIFNYIIAILKSYHLIQTASYLFPEFNIFAIYLMLDTKMSYQSVFFFF